VKLFFNFDGAHSDTLRKNHEIDIKILFGLPFHKNVMTAYHQFRAEIGIHELQAFQISETHCPFLFEQVRNTGKQRMQIVVMPWCPKSLADIIVEKVLTIEQVIKYSLNLACALEHLHTTGKVCHCDLKPSNILVNNNDELVLIDFGACAYIGNTWRGGNGQCQPPEYTQNIKILASYDVFGFGCVVYAMLSGQTSLFDKISTNCRWKSIQKSLPLTKSGFGAFTIKDIPFEGSLPNQLKDIVTGALNPTPDNRIKLCNVISLLQTLNKQ